MKTTGVVRSFFPTFELAYRPMLDEYTSGDNLTLHTLETDSDSVGIRVSLITVLDVERMPENNEGHKIYQIMGFNALTLETIDCTVVFDNLEGTQFVAIETNPPLLALTQPSSE